MLHDPEFSWFLPTSGDLESFGRPETSRDASLDYLTRVARAAEAAGFVSVLIPVGDACEDAWVVGGIIAARTETLKMLVAVRPGFVAPVVAAKMVSTFDQLMPGRLLVNVVTGGFPAELAADGDFTPHDERYERTAEFMDVMRKYWTERKFDHEGKFYRVEGCKPMVKCATQPHPALYAGGASTPAEDLFAEAIDTYLLWGESTEQMRERITRMRQKAAIHGRELRFGVRFHVLSRDTHDEAMAAAAAQLEGVTPEQIARTQSVLNATDSAGESRQRAFVGAEGLWVEPNLWSGIGQVRRGIGVTVIGSHEEVARKFLSFTDLGLSFFILSGYPHLEEAENAGRTWMPLFYDMVRQRSATLAAG